MPDDNDNPKEQNQLIPKPEAEDVDKLFSFLHRMIDLYYSEQEVKQAQLSAQNEQVGLERMRIEKDFEIKKEALSAHEREVVQFYENDRRRFDRIFWAVVIFGAALFVGVAVLMAFASNYDQRVKIFAYAVGVIISLLSGKGLSDILSSRARRAPKE